MLMQLTEIYIMFLGAAMKDKKIPLHLTLEQFRLCDLSVIGCHNAPFEKYVWGCNGIECSKCVLGDNARTVESVLDTTKRLLEKENL